MQSLCCHGFFYFKIQKYLKEKEKIRILKKKLLGFASIKKIFIENKLIVKKKKKNLILFFYKRKIQETNYRKIEIKKKWNSRSPK